MKKREKQRAAQLYRNERQAAANKLQKWANLHPAAKMKRVISLCSHWFGKNNLPNDAFIVNTMVQHHGWMPLHTLLSFPRMQKWVDEPTVLAALSVFDKYETRGGGHEASEGEPGVVCFRPRAFGHAWREAIRNDLVREVRSHHDLESDAVDDESLDPSLALGSISRTQLRDWQSLETTSLRRLHDALGVHTLASFEEDEQDAAAKLAKTAGKDELVALILPASPTPHPWSFILPTPGLSYSPPVVLRTHYPWSFL